MDVSYYANIPTFIFTGSILLLSKSFMTYRVSLSPSATLPERSASIYSFGLPLAFFITGILLQKVYPLSLSLLTIFLLFSLMSIVMARQFFYKNLLMIGYYVTFLFCGHTVFATQNFFYEKTVSLLKGKIFTLHAIVQEGTINKELLSKRFLPQCLHLTVRTLYDHSSKKEKNVSFKILCYCSLALKFFAGDTLKIENVTFKEAHNSPTLFRTSTFHDYLKREKIVGTVFIKEEQVSLLQRPRFSIARFLRQTREEVYIRIRKKMNTQTFAYFSSLFLGNKKDVELDASKNWFSFWGISHYLARSGLHIVLFILFWRKILQIFPLWHVLKQLILVFLCFVYYFLSWESISFLRAFFAFLIYQLGALSNYQTHPFHILSLVCLVTLLLNPMHVFFLDFQLSFALTFALLWISQPVKTMHSQ